MGLSLSVFRCHGLQVWSDRSFREWCLWERCSTNAWSALVCMSGSRHVYLLRTGVALQSGLSLQRGILGEPSSVISGRIRKKTIFWSHSGLPCDGPWRVPRHLSGIVPWIRVIKKLVKSLRGCRFRVGQMAWSGNLITRSRLFEMSINRSAMVGHYHQRWFSFPPPSNHEAVTESIKRMLNEKMAVARMGSSTKRAKSSELELEPTIRMSNPP